MGEGWPQKGTEGAKGEVFNWVDIVKRMGNREIEKKEKPWNTERGNRGRRRERGRGWSAILGPHKGAEGAKEGLGNIDKVEYRERNYRIRGRHGNGVGMATKRHRRRKRGRGILSNEWRQENGEQRDKRRRNCGTRKGENRGRRRERGRGRSET